MKKTTKIYLSILTAGILLWLAFGFFGVQTLFVDKEVKEEIPGSISAILNQEATESSDPEEGNSRLLGKGVFEQGDSSYTISGNAFLSQHEDQYNLTFTDFEVTNGPALVVYAVKTSSTKNESVKDAIANGDFIDLGTLKGNIGDQNYLLKKKFDSKEYQVISIWCQRFSRNFGSAHLTIP